MRRRIATRADFTPQSSFAYNPACTREEQSLGGFGYTRRTRYGLLSRGPQTRYGIIDRGSLDPPDHGGAGRLFRSARRLPRPARPRPRRLARRQAGGGGRRGVARDAG